MPASAPTELPFAAAPVRRAARAGALYRQVADDLEARIRDGVLAPGARLPAEPAIARAYGVNRLTAREAIGVLVRQGLVRREHGVGTYVAEAPVRHRIGGFDASLTESMRAQGLSVRNELLGIAREDGETVAGGPFPAFPGPVARLRIRRLVGDLPWSLTLTWVPASLLYPDFDFGPDSSLFARLLERHGLRMLRADRVFGAAPADDADAEHLDVPQGAALLLLSGGNVDQHGRRIAHVAHRIRGDRAEYAIELRPGAA